MAYRINMEELNIQKIIKKIYEKHEFNILWKSD